MSFVTKKEYSMNTKCGFVILLLCLCFIAASTKLTSYDFWWHLKTGETILETGDIPGKDIFSFTAYGTPRIAHEWFAEILFYLFFQIGGIPLMILFKALIISFSFFMIILYLMKQDVPLRFIGLSIILSLWGARFRFSDRTELFSLFFTVLILFLLYDSRKSRHRWKLYAIIPATLLWANLHGAAVLSPLFLLLFTLGEVLNRFADHRFKQWGRQKTCPHFSFLHIFIVLLLVFSSTLINPHGIQIWKATMEAKAIHSSGFAINTEWARPDLALFPLFYVAMVIFFIVAGLSIKRLDGSKFLITLFLLLLALNHLRAIGLFFLALPFFLATHLPHMSLTSKGKEFFQRLLGSKAVGVLVVVSILLSIPFFLFYKGLQEFGFTLKKDRFPVEASNFLEKHYKGKFLYNDVKFGGYLIWRFYPERKVFIDGRNEIYVPLVQRISKGLNDYDEWLNLLSDYNIDAALVSYWPRLKGVIYAPDPEMGIARKGYRAYSTFLFLKRDWALVYWDDLTMVFFKRLERYEEVIRKYEYKYLNPEDCRYLLSLSENDENLRQNLIDELLRRMREEPPSKRAAALLEEFK